MYNVEGYVVHNKKGDFDSLALDDNGNFGALTYGQQGDFAAGKNEGSLGSYFWK